MKKIMFNDKYGLTRAVLEGRKTMTRRLVPEGTPFGNWEETLKKSRYQPGEVVAVAQPYMDLSYNIGTVDGAKKLITLSKTAGLRNKMFVSADIMPHQIRITNVRVERLQDISDEECLREGVRFYNCGIDYGYRIEGIRGPFSTARAAFAALIDKVFGKGTWQSNPWVFVYEFELER